MSASDEGVPLPRAGLHNDATQGMPLCHWAVPVPEPTRWCWSRDATRDAPCVNCGLGAPPQLRTQLHNDARVVFKNRSASREQRDVSCVNEASVLPCPHARPHAGRATAVSTPSPLSAERGSTLQGQHSSGCVNTAGTTFIRVREHCRDNIHQGA